jgi:hypothetical protein
MRQSGTGILPFLPFSFIILAYYIMYSIINYNEENYMHEDFDEEEENFIKVAIVEDTAYWIINNVLYQADFVDGEILKEEARPIDAFEIGFDDVNKLMDILDNMQDWKN